MAGRVIRRLMLVAVLIVSTVVAYDYYQSHRPPPSWTYRYPYTKAGQRWCGATRTYPCGTLEHDQAAQAATIETLLVFFGCLIAGWAAWGFAAWWWRGVTES